MGCGASGVKHWASFRIIWLATLRGSALTTRWGMRWCEALGVFRYRIIWLATLRDAAAAEDDDCCLRNVSESLEQQLKIPTLPRVSHYNPSLAHHHNSRFQVNQSLLSRSKALVVVSSLPVKSKLVTHNPSLHRVTCTFRASAKPLFVIYRGQIWPLLTH